MARFRTGWPLALSFAWAWTALLTAVSAAGAAELRVVVVGMGSGNGLVHFGLYDNPDTFPDSDGRLDGTRVAITGGRAVAVFKGLKPGRYAVAVYHDENANGEFDQGIFGLPLENYGFSNKAFVFFGPPAFENAAVTVPAKGLSITIRVD